ncbi:MAG: hypothetical protein M3O50_13045 [Myxococcota bacterium]|nr:hypothetical protein [Myxococcota bacterium]
MASPPSGTPAPHASGAGGVPPPVQVYPVAPAVVQATLASGAQAAAAAPAVLQQYSVDPEGPGTASVLHRSDGSVCSGRLLLVHEKPIEGCAQPVTAASGPHVLAMNATSTQQ